MATRLTDVYVPELYTGYQRVDDPERTRFFDSGIVTRSPLLDSLSNQGGRIAEIPFWNDLDASDAPNVSTDNPGSDATPESVAADHQLGILARLNQGWSAMDLAAEMSGDDPVGQINARVDSYWNRQWQRRLIAAVNGVAAHDAATTDDMSEDITATTGTPDASNLFNAESFLDAAFTIGDRVDEMAGIAMHSRVMLQARKENLIDFVRDSDDNILFPTYQGLPIIVDDGLPAIPDDTRVKYTTVIFGPGAFGFGVGTPEVPVEVDRRPRAGDGGGQEEIWFRRTWLLHPFGFRLDPTEVAGDGGATLDELEDADLYERVVDRKNVPLAFLVTNG